MSKLSVAAKEPKKKYGKYEDYEIEGAARTIIEAEEIKADKEKMKYVGPCLEKKISGMTKAVKSIQDLKDIRQEKFAKGGTEEMDEEEESEEA